MDTRRRAGLPSQLGLRRDETARQANRHECCRASVSDADSETTDSTDATDWGAHAARVLVGKPGRSFTCVTAAARRNNLLFNHEFTRMNAN